MNSTRLQYAGYLFNLFYDIIIIDLYHHHHYHHQYHRSIVIIIIVIIIIIIIIIIALLRGSLSSDLRGTFLHYRGCSTHWSRCEDRTYYQCIVLILPAQ